jgi:hypothetical protein
VTVFAAVVVAVVAVVIVNMSMAELVPTFSR